MHHLESSPDLRDLAHRLLRGTVLVGQDLEQRTCKQTYFGFPAPEKGFFGYWAVDNSLEVLPRGSAAHRCQFSPYQFGHPLALLLCCHGKEEVALVCTNF